MDGQMRGKQFEMVCKCSKATGRFLAKIIEFIRIECVKGEERTKAMNSQT